jgi:RluA family pseudouridine synthase
MRLLWSLAAIAAVTSSTSSVSAFSVQQNSAISRGSTALNQVAVATADVKAKQDATLEKLKSKDAGSNAISKDDLNVVFEDDHIVVVSKPSGVLTVPGKDESNPSLNKAVFDRYGSESGRMDKMVVHRLGMDTSGLVVFARTNAALRGMNTLFRTRKVTRQYEALVCGHLAQDEGLIDLPLMRDYEYPPFMRVSTDDHQRALIELDADEVGKKLLESPKDSLTKYEVVSREDMDGNDVSRLTLTSISGRTHQLNVHCAAIGHPIVGDAVYGYGGEAASNGGLDDADLPADKASAELQKAIASACGDKPMCVHAKSISFRHPVTKEELSFESKASF